MKMKLYYVVKDNTKVMGHEPDLVYISGPYGTYGQAIEQRQPDSYEYVAEQEIEVDF